jgi:hypothetical protein
MIETEIAPRYVNTNGLAKITGLSPRYIQLKVADGTLSCIRLGRRAIRFNIEDCCEALEKFATRKPRFPRVQKGRMGDD